MTELGKGLGILGEPGPSSAVEDDLSIAIDEVIKARADREKELTELEVEQLVIESLEVIYARFLTLPALRDKTLKVYGSAFERFRDWCRDNGVTPVPARVGMVASYLHGEIQAGASPEKIRRYVAAISYLHKFRKAFDPTDDPLIHAITRSTTAQKANGHSIESINSTIEVSANA